MQTIIVIKVQQNMQRKYHREYVEYRIDNKYSRQSGISIFGAIRSNLLLT